MMTSLDTSKSVSSLLAPVPGRAFSLGADIDGQRGAKGHRSCLIPCTECAIGLSLNFGCNLHAHGNPFVSAGNPRSPTASAVLA